VAGRLLLEKFTLSSARLQRASDDRSKAHSFAARAVASFKRIWQRWDAVILVGYQSERMAILSTLLRTQNWSRDLRLAEKPLCSPWGSHPALCVRARCAQKTSSTSDILIAIQNIQIT